MARPFVPVGKAGASVATLGMVGPSRDPATMARPAGGNSSGPRHCSTFSPYWW